MGTSVFPEASALAILRAPAALVALIVALAPGAARADVYSDGRDRWTLLDQKLVNRELGAQLDALPGRLVRAFGPLSAAADVMVGTELATPWAGLSRFHGFFVLDGYFAVRLIDGVDVNLNPVVMNISASDGYRSSAGIYAGLAAHFYGDLFTFGGAPVRGDLLGPDLDLVTLGQGLLVEQVPLEGVRGSLRWNDLELTNTFIGQAFFFNDDVNDLALSYAGRTLGVHGTFWRLTEPTLEPASGGGPRLVNTRAYYLAVFGELSPGETVRIAAEAGGRLDDLGHPTFAAMLRADWLSRLGPRIELHLGAQARYYRRRFSPAARTFPPQSIYNVPSRELAYVTNSFEYFASTPEYDQWSYTVMAELRLHLSELMTAVADSEAWLLFVRDPSQPIRVSYIDDRRVPGILPRAYYRVGLELRDGPGGLWRLSAYVANKLVHAGETPTVPLTRRFDVGPLFLLRMEVFL